MNRIHCLLILFLCLALTSRAQMAPNEQSYADSLVNVLQHSPSDSVKARLKYLLADYWKTKDTLKAREYLEQGRRDARRYPMILALGDFYEGWLYFDSDHDKAAALFSKTEQAMARFKEPEAYEFRAASLYNYALMRKADEGDAFVIDVLLNQAIPLSEKGHNKQKTAHFYSQLATLLMYNAQFDKAAIYNEKAVKLLEGHFPQSSALVLAYLSTTSNFIYSGKKQEAREALSKARAMLEGHPESVNYPLYYYNEGTWYVMAEQFDKAFVSLDKGISMARELKQAMVLQMLIFRKYNIFLERQQYSQGKQFLVAVSKDTVFMSDANNRKTVYFQLSQLNANLGAMGDAYQSLLAYNKINDSLNNAQLKLKINTLEVKYRTAEKEKTISRLESANKIATLSAKNNRLAAWLSGVAAIILLVIAAFSVYYYRTNKKLSAQKEINHRQQLKEIEQRQQLSNIRAMMQGEERERERVARDLHDGLGGLLTGVKIDLSKIKDQATTETRLQEQLSAASRQLDGAINELRRIARNMMPETLLRFGLEAALKDFCEGLESPGTEILLQCYGMEQHKLQANVQLTIYRIVQELVTNALKHAKANRILVDCIVDEEQVSITVEDNGTGFDPQQVKSNGSGLSNVRTRVDYLNGKLDIQFAANTGTSINIQFHEHATADIPLNS
jgi:signal transduction histidine kinase